MSSIKLFSLQKLHTLGSLANQHTFMKAHGRVIIPYIWKGSMQSKMGKYDLKELYPELAFDYFCPHKISELASVV